MTEVKKNGIMFPTACECGGVTERVTNVCELPYIQCANRNEWVGVGMCVECPDMRKIGDANDYTYRDERGRPRIKITNVVHCLSEAQTS